MSPHSGYVQIQKVTVSTPLDSPNVYTMSLSSLLHGSHVKFWNICTHFKPWCFLLVHSSCGCLIGVKVILSLLHVQSCNCIGDGSSASFPSTVLLFVGFLDTRITRITSARCFWMSWSVVPVTGAGSGQESWNRICHGFTCLHKRWRAGKMLRVFF